MQPGRSTTFHGSVPPQSSPNTWRRLARYTHLLDTADLHCPAICIHENELATDASKYLFAEVSVETQPNALEGCGPG